MSHRPANAVPDHVQVWRNCHHAIFVAGIIRARLSSTSACFAKIGRNEVSDLELDIIELHSQAPSELHAHVSTGYPQCLSRYTSSDNLLLNLRDPCAVQCGEGLWVKSPTRAPFGVLADQETLLLKRRMVLMCGTRESWRGSVD